MSVRWITALFCFLPFTLWAQGFAGLGQGGEGFALPEPGYQFSFPSDQGPHPDFRIEWWYITANMTGPDGTPYGLQWTLFRTALAPGDAAGWNSPQVWMGHAAVTTPTDHLVSERLGRGGVGQAGVTTTPFQAWIDDWTFADLPGVGYRLAANAPQFGYDVQLAPAGPRVFQGEAGYSVKSRDGQASYYYSEPFLDLTGTLSLPDGDVSVTGTAWLDREWSSEPLSDNQTGWDWFSLSFDSGAKLMGFRLRETGGGAFTSATWIEPDGQTTAFGDGAFSATPIRTAVVADRTIPVEWQVTLPVKGVDVTVEAINEQAWMALSIPYWEGPVSVRGSHDGIGYLEMTGYDVTD